MCSSDLLKLQSRPFAAKYGEFPSTEQDPLVVEMRWIEPEPFRYFLRVSFCIQAFNNSTTDWLSLKVIGYFLGFQYLYNEHCDFGMEDAVSVLKAARDFEIGPLVRICTDRIQGGIRVQNAAFIFEKSREYSEEALEKKAKEYILEHARLVFKSAGFLQLSSQKIGRASCRERV